ncbi:hypothetical protein [Nostoc sp. FACHB-110]|uniref:hypothetical protein n=1 Tax=Nostoc sp. FACHB-110 TaxID=2692834 RepID=UPI0037C9CB08
MEHWQFLIQKQGDRSWHTLESPNIQILEGRYRVLARSNLPNTDVEVRVTHSSTHEVPPKRRIQRQSRRTNSEGLMAVIPFTHLKLGIWEVRCSGDLMSDILGKSWQYSIHLQVLSQLPNQEVENFPGGGNGESSSLDFMIQLPNQKNIHEPERFLVSISPETLAPSEAPQELTLIASDRNIILTTEETTDSNTVTSEQAIDAVSLEVASSGETEKTTDSDLATTELPNAEISLTSDRALGTSTEEIADTEAITSGQISLEPTLPDATAEISGTEATTNELPSEEISVETNLSGSTEELTDSNVVTAELAGEEIPLEYSLSDSTEEITNSDAVTSELPGEEISLEQPLLDSTEEITNNDAVTSELPNEEISLEQPLLDSTEENTNSYLVATNIPADTEEYAIIDQPASPLWLKGDTAEQILQNLMELALPTAELLLDDEEFEEDPIIPPAPPLLLTLERENYIARWGQGLGINARVELQENTSLENEPEYATILYALEARIELRSPLSSAVLAQFRQPLAENSLPLTINTAINIPAECDSKLLLGELNLYGALTDFGEVMLLASRSFTVMAEVTELLAITAVSKLSQQNFLENGALSVSVPSQESAASVSLGLELFNLVKTSPNQPQTILPSPSQPLPPQINLLTLKKTEDLRSPKLPKLPEVQNSAIATDDVIPEPASQAQAELEENHEAISTPTTIPLAPINLEQLSIKNRRKFLLGNTFPFLKRLETLPVEETAATASASPESEIPIAEESLQLTANTDESASSETEDSLPLAVADPKDENSELPDDSVAEVIESLPEVADTPTLELSDEANIQQTVSLDADSHSAVLTKSVPEIIDAQSLGFSEDAITQPTVPNTTFVGEGNPYSSPLIRKWMQSQGYFVPEPPPLPPVRYQSQETEISEEQNLPNEAEPEPLEPSWEISSVDTDLWSNSETNVSEDNLAEELWGEPETSQSEENLSAELWGDSETGIITEDAENLPISAETQTENVPQDEATPTLQLSQLALSQKIKIPRAWLAQEIVVDDTYSESDESSIQSLVVESRQPNHSAVLTSVAIAAEMSEPLPIPQLHIPEGELIAGQSVRVRVELPEVPPQVVVKLWIEDFQTRGLLDGPHVLKDLLPNLLGGVEVMTQINVPFGCVEIRLEAIAFHTSTQQESHKVTVVRTVIPPDLPNLQVDELLGL